MVAWFTHKPRRKLISYSKYKMRKRRCVNEYMKKEMISRRLATRRLCGYMAKMFEKETDTLIQR